MGELKLTESHESEPPIPVNSERPMLIIGEVVIGRTTNIEINLEDFLGSSTLINLSNIDISKTVNRKAHLVRKKTEPEDVVRSVLKISHADEFERDRARLEQTTEDLFTDFHASGMNLADRFIVEALEEKYEKIKTTDLMRGMAAFREAEYEQHQGIYDLTIIKPAILLASWMITKESSSDLV